MSFLSLAFLLVLTSPSQASNNNICILQQQEIDKGGRECASEWSNLFASVVKEPYLDSQYIVRFTSYRAAEEQRKELRGALGPEGHGWTWVERHNKAAAYPTDFGLIQLGKSVLDYFQVLTASFPTIRDIHPDHPITQALKWDSLNQGPLHAKAGDGDSVEKLPGRLRTRPTIGLDDEVDLRDILSQRKLKMLETQKSFASILKADQIWSLGHTGKNIKMGVFDTGVRKDHPHIRNIKERTNWTHEQTLDDGLGHGSFVAGVIASSFEGCRGLAPDVDLHTFRVFTNDQVSFTSWFMDAFNYAIITEMDVVNLSIGGPDYLDEPFVDKVMEITSNGILMVSALGNDGPLYGTLNNPADQNDVIGVGGMTYKNEIASFSSRGMSLWELPVGYGRIKPDVMAYGQDVLGSKISSGCRSLSGTSVASPVAAGAVCLLASTVPESKRWDIVNPASMKQALVEGAVRLDRLHVYEQGNGALNLHNSMAILQDYEPRASLVPASIDLTDCPYMWPFCAQSLYARAMPVMLNATILNGMGVVGEISTAPVYEPSGENGNLIEMDFDYSSSLWPWSGYLALYITVQPSASEFDGTAEGTITFTVSSPPAEGEDARRFSTVAVPFKARIIPTPRRENRLLWDQFHSIRYPPAYIPRDNLDVKSDILDWHGDHLHTNYHRMFNYLTSKGYFLEVLASPLTCFNANEYGALMIVDSEDEFYPEEVAKLEKDVRNSGLGLIVFADWYNLEAMKKAKFFDDNTRSWWTPVTGGANVPALNDLLDPYGIAFGDAVLQGKVTIHGETIRFASGVNIMKFPTGGHLQAFHLDAKYGGRSSGLGEYEVLGLTEVGHGKIAVYGDSNCLDASHMDSECFGLIHGMIDYATGSSESSNTIQKFVKDMTELQTEFYSAGSTPPVRPESVNFTEVSFTLQRPLQCYQNAGHQLPKELIEEFPDVMASTVGVPQAHIVWKEAMTTAEHAPDIVEDDATVQKDEKYKGMHVSGPEDPSQPMPYVLLGNQEGYSKTMGPPALLSRWTLFFGVVIVISLYRVTRRRRVSRERSIRGD